MHQPKKNLIHHFLFCLLLICSLSAETGSQNKAIEEGALDLARHYLNKGRFEDCIETLRQWLEQNPANPSRSEAEFILGKAFLLNKQPQLASLAFEKLRQNYPDQPDYQSSVFLEVETALEKMTSLANFTKSIEKIASFPPFGLDLDFFKFFTGFTKGYTLKDYEALKPRLKPFFQSQDPDLRFRALFLDALVRQFDFSDEGALFKIRDLPASAYHRHLASLALMIHRISSTESDWKSLAKLLPADWNTTRTGVLAQILVFQYALSQDGEFSEAARIFEKIRAVAPADLLQKLEKHIEILAIMQNSVNSEAKHLQACSLLQSHSSYNLAVRCYQDILQKLKAGPLLASVHYRLGKIFQDDLNQTSLATEHFEKALKLPLPKEYKEELEWRKIKSLKPEERKTGLRATAVKPSAFREAALLEQLKLRDFDGSLIDAYYQTLNQMNLEPASTQDALLSLSQVALDSNQFGKAQFFLEQMAEYDVDEADRLLRQLALRQKIVESSRRGLLSQEPEQIELQNARYLIESNQREEARSILLKIQDLPKVKAEAEFELLRLDMGPLPLRKDMELKWIELFKTAKEEVRKAMAPLLMAHFEALFAKEPSSKKERQSSLELQKQIYMDAQTIPSLSPAFLHGQQISILLLQKNTDEARKILKTHFKTGDVDFLENLQKIQIHEEDFEGAAQTLLSLLKKDGSRSEWLRQLASIEQTQAQGDQILIDKLIQWGQDYKQIFALALSPLMPEWVRKFGSDPDFIELLNRFIEDLARTGEETLKQALSAASAKNTDLQPALVSFLSFRGRKEDQEHLIEIALEGQEPAALQAMASICQSLKTGLFLAELNPRLKATAKKQFLQNPSDRTFKSLTVLLNDKELQDLLRTHKNDISEQRRLFVVAEQSISRLSGESEAPDFQKAMANPDISANDKFYLLHQAYLQLGKAQKLDSPLLKQWLFRIDSRKLSRPEMRQFHDLAQVVNSLSMISALKKDIDWDDPQNKNNLRSLLQIGDLYLKGLKDPNQAATTYQQIRDTFTGSEIQDELTARDENVALFRLVYTLLARKNLRDSQKAARILSQQLKMLPEALEILEDCQHLCRNQTEKEFLLIQKSGLLIDLNRLDEARDLISSLPPTVRSFKTSLLARLSASTRLSSYTNPKTASLERLLELIDLQIEQMNALDEAKTNIELALTRKLKPQDADSVVTRMIHWSKACARQNRSGQTMLEKALDFASSGLKPRILFELGELSRHHDPQKAIREFSEASSGKGPYAQLSLLSLISLQEDLGQKENALASIKRFKAAVSPEVSKRTVEPKEVTIKKSILTSKLEHTLAEGDANNPDFVLEMARNLASEEQYADEAEQKYLLYLRLVQDETPRLQGQMELASFYYKQRNFTQALAQFQKVFQSAVDVHLRYKSGLEAARILGLDMQNFTASIQLARQVRALMLPQAEFKTIEQFIQQMKRMADNQKTVTLRNLNYSHLPQILEIKRTFYKKQDYAGGAKEMESLLKTTSSFPLQLGLHYELGRLYDLKLKKFKEALEHYLKFIEGMENPEVTSEVLLRVAEIRYTEMKQPKIALADYLTYVQKYPAAKKRLPVLFQIAQIEANHNNNYSKALDVYTDIANAYPQTTHEQKARFAQASILADKLSDFNGSIVAYRNLVNSNFESSLAPEALFQIARIYEVQLNDPNRAITTYEELISRYPSSTYAADARRQIDKIRNR